MALQFHSSRLGDEGLGVHCEGDRTGSETEGTSGPTLMRKSPLPTCEQENPESRSWGTVSLGKIEEPRVAGVLR